MMSTRFILLLEESMVGILANSSESTVIRYQAMSVLRSLYKNKNYPDVLPSAASKIVANYENMEEELVKEALDAHHEKKVAGYLLGAFLVKKYIDSVIKGSQGFLASSSSSSGDRGTLEFKLEGQWAFAHIKHLEIKITNRSKYSNYTESSNGPTVYFMSLPYGTYDFNIAAYEQKYGTGGQPHSLKGTISHSCKTTRVNIDAGGGFIGPSIHKSCF